MPHLRQIMPQIAANVHLELFCRILNDDHEFATLVRCPSAFEQIGDVAQHGAALIFGIFAGVIGNIVAQICSHLDNMVVSLVLEQSDAPIRTRFT